MYELPFLLPKRVGHRIRKTRRLLELVSILDAVFAGDFVKLRPYHSQEYSGLLSLK